MLVVLRDAGAAEICPWDTFNTSCSEGEVVLVQHALYGRMELGRCLTRDFGFLGCSVDVLTYVEHLCSGRPACSLSLPDKVLDTLPSRPCPADLGAYLELSYTCVQGTSHHLSKWSSFSYKLVADYSVFTPLSIQKICFICLIPNTNSIQQYICTYM